MIRGDRRFIFTFSLSLIETSLVSNELAIYPVFMTYNQFLLSWGRRADISFVDLKGVAFLDGFQQTRVSFELAENVDRTCGHDFPITAIWCKAEEKTHARALGPIGYVTHFNHIASIFFLNTCLGLDIKIHFIAPKLCLCRHGQMIPDQLGCPGVVEPGKKDKFSC